MKNIIYKELKLVLSPATYFYALCSATIVAPNYPVFASIVFILCSFINTFMMATGNNDLLFSALLPIKRSDIVLGKHVTVIFVELAYLIVTIPFALLATKVVSPDGNIVGLDANLSYYGISLVCYGIFNLCLLPYFFKTGTKAGLGILFGMFFCCLFYAIIQALVYIPLLPLKYLDGTAAEGLPYRIVMLIVGIVVFIVFNAISYFVSVKKFEKVSL